ncbi:MAG: hypothetical protein H6Q89_3741 [Myxococcaceae bacterium]|nr:hypothetical protein [Myxococcaceae bacterium]
MRRPIFCCLLLSACSFRPSEAPVTPKVVVGTATVSGRVLDLSSLPVEQMRVTCPESDASAVTGPDGKWTLEVPADTTITLRAVPVDPLNVFKDVTFGPLQLSNRSRLENVELLSVPGSTLGGLNGIAGADEVRGVLAVKVVSLSGRCTPDDGTIELPQTTTARAIYNLPNTSQPDRNLVKMQPNTRPQAWLSGIAPGTYHAVKFTKPGCAQLPYPVAYQKVSWLGGFRLQAKALSQITVFIE